MGRSVGCLLVPHAATPSYHIPSFSDSCVTFWLTGHSSLTTLAPTRHDAAACLALRSWENADDEGEGLPPCPSRQQTADAWRISLRQHDSEGNPAMSMYELIPLAMWLALLIGLLVPTWGIYKIAGSAVQSNFAQLKGTISGFAIELGGPVAFFMLLAWLGKDFIPHDIDITLSGTVESVDGQPLQGYRVASVNFSPIGDTFKIQTKRNESNSYSFLVSKGGLSFLIENQFVDNNNTKDIKISDFPDMKVTKIRGEKIKDNKGREFPDGYSIDIIPSIRPRPVFIQDGKIEINIEHGTYKVAMQDNQKKDIGEDFLTDVNQGGIIILPPQLNFSAME
jgi:hypothetical protein